jgi:hypothetical protein
MRHLIHLDEKQQRPPVLKVQLKVVRLAKLSRHPGCSCCMCPEPCHSLLPLAQCDKDSH